MAPLSVLEAPPSVDDDAQTAENVRGASSDVAFGPGTPRAGAARAAAALPARLSPAAWLGALDAAGSRAVQVALGDDGTVRLRTERDGDGVAVRLHFSDPDLQALAGAHADRLRDLLSDHFSEPVHLSFGDGSGAGGGSQGTGDGAPRDRDRDPSASGATPEPSPPSRSPAPGRREWIG